LAITRHCHADDDAGVNSAHRMFKQLLTMDDGNADMENDGPNIRTGMVWYSRV